LAILGKMKNFYHKLFPRLADYLKRELEGCESILDLGCGQNSPLQHCPIPYSVGIDLFEPYLRESKRKGIHSEYVLADVRNIEFRPKSFDCVLATELIEHLTKEEGYRLIEKMERIARKKVILTTPNGFLPQTSYDGNKFQIHRPGWTVTELKRLGYKVKGINGTKFLRKERGELKLKILILSDLTQKIVYHFPKFAFQLLAVKNVDNVEQ